LANALVASAAYIGQFFYPARLAALYPHPGIALPIGKVVIAAVVLTAVSAAVFAWRRRRPYLLVGWLWYLGMLLPVIGLVPVGFHAMADRYTYLPQIGLSMAIVWAAKDLFGAWPYRHWVGVSISVLWVTGLIIVAWVQTTYWRDSESLWTHVLACTSRNHRAENNLGNVLFQHGRLPEAIVHYQNAIAIRPDFAEAYNNLGLALANRGETDEAIALYGTALKIQADYAGAHYNLGNALVQQGKTSEAIEHFQKAHEIQPDFAESHQNLGALLYQQRQIPQALAQWRELIRLQPDTIPILNVTAWKRWNWRSARSGFRPAGTLPSSIPWPPLMPRLADSMKPYKLPSKPLRWPQASRIPYWRRKSKRGSSSTRQASLAAPRNEWINIPY
jgi:tetratricopeptide (TPR) repeat protein